jgi:hypothetical protein
MDRKALPSDLTSYDFLKFTALALMVVDHVGVYFLPDDDWLRAVGRLSAPIWLFLIGYARSRDFSLPMWIGIALLALSGVVFGGSILPFSILATMLACRFALDPLMAVIKRSPSLLYPVSLVLFFATILTFPVLEYGSIAMTVVMFGYMTRNRESLPFDKNQYLQYGILVAFGYFLIQAYMFFGFDMNQKIFVGLGLLATILGLSFFQPRAYPLLTARLPRPLVGLIQVGGRYSLEFYVAHILLFKGIAAYYGIDIYGFFDFSLLS